MRNQCCKVYYKISNKNQTVCHEVEICLRKIVPEGTTSYFLHLVK